MLRGMRGSVLWINPVLKNKLWIEYLQPQEQSSWPKEHFYWWTISVPSRSVSLFITFAEEVCKGFRRINHKCKHSVYRPRPKNILRKVYFCFLVIYNACFLFLQKHMMGISHHFVFGNMWQTRVWLFVPTVWISEYLFVTTKFMFTSHRNIFWKPNCVNYKNITGQDGDKIHFTRYLMNILSVKEDVWKSKQKLNCLKVLPSHLCTRNISNFSNLTISVSSQIHI